MRDEVCLIFFFFMSWFCLRGESFLFVERLWIREGVEILFIFFIRGCIFFFGRKIVFGEYLKW